MNRSIPILMLFLTLSATATAYTYTIDSYQVLPDLHDTESMLITGQGGGAIYLSDSSSLTIESTSMLNQGTGGVWEVHPGYNSSLYMSGGQVHEIAIINDATAFLSGGLIEQIWSQQNAWKWYYPGEPDPPVLVPNPHIEMICREYDYNATTKKLLGLWNVDADNNGLFDSFNIQLVNVTGCSPAIENIKFTIIPEPATLSLVALGVLLLRRRQHTGNVTESKDIT